MYLFCNFFMGLAIIDVRDLAEEILMSIFLLKKSQPSEILCPQQIYTKNFRICSFH